MKALRYLFRCLCCMGPTPQHSHYSNDSSFESQCQVISGHKAPHAISVEEHYSYVDGVFIFDKAKVTVVKTERNPWESSQEEPVFPTEERVNVVRRRLSCD
jgi:hypothetical protein